MMFRIISFTQCSDGPPQGGVCIPHHYGWMTYLPMFRIISFTQCFDGPPQGGVCIPRRL